MLYTSVILLHLLILQLSVQTVWLKQEFGRRCYFPDQSGNFQFDHEVGHTVFALMVEGAPIQRSESVICTTPSTNPVNTTPFYKPSGSKKDLTFNVKVVKANMRRLPNGKVEFDKIEQTHISINDHGANVHTVNNAVQSKWGPDFFVVTGDGLEVDDSTGTQGIMFPWQGVCIVLGKLLSHFSGTVFPYKGHLSLLLTCEGA